MKLEDVLLTPKEARKACDEFQFEHWRECDEYDSCQDCPVQPKAQCLKLLEWQEQWCKDHFHVTPHRHFECLECIYDLNKRLKEK